MMVARPGDLLGSGVQHIHRNVPALPPLRPAVSLLIARRRFALPLLCASRSSLLGRRGLLLTRACRGVCPIQVLIYPRTRCYLTVVVFISLHGRPRVLMPRSPGLLVLSSLESGYLSLSCSSSLPLSVQHRAMDARRVAGRHSAAWMIWTLLAWSFRHLDALQKHLEEFLPRVGC